MGIFWIFALNHYSSDIKAIIVLYVLFSLLKKKKKETTANLLFIYIGPWEKNDLQYRVHSF